MAVPASRELALRCADLCLQKGGIDLMVYHLPAGHLFDFAVIVIGRSERQVHAMAEEVQHFCKRQRVAHFPLEGQGGWHLLDCHDVVVHALTSELRDFYRLDRLWPGSTIIDHDRELADLPPLDAPMPATGSMD